MKKIIKFYVSIIVLLSFSSGCGFMQAYYTSNYDGSSNQESYSNTHNSESSNCVSYRTGNSEVVFTNNCKQDKLIHFNYESRGGNWLSTSIFVLGDGGKRTVKISSRCIVKNIRIEDA